MLSRGINGDVMGFPRNRLGYTAYPQTTVLKFDFGVPSFSDKPYTHRFFLQGHGVTARVVHLEFGIAWTTWRIHPTLWWRAAWRSCIMKACDRWSFPIHGDTPKYHHPAIGLVFSHGNFYHPAINKGVSPWRWKAPASWNHHWSSDWMILAAIHPFWFMSWEIILYQKNIGDEFIPERGIPFWTNQDYPAW